MRNLKVKIQYLNPCSISYCLLVSVRMQAVLPFDIRSPEVVGVEATIGRLLTTCPTQNVNTPSRVHIVPKLGVSEDHFTQVLSAVAVFPPEFLASVFRFLFDISDLIWPVVFIV